VSYVRVVPREDRDILGEGPLWSVRHKALFWVDIIGQKIHRLNPCTGETTAWAIPERIGWIIERRNTEVFVAGLKSGFAFVQLDPLLISPIGNPEPERPFNRQNDAIADDQGRIWAGTKDDRELDATGALYRLDPDLRWQRMDDHYKVTNGPVFSPDYRTLYHTDSFERTVYAFDLDSDGTLTNRRIWLRFPNEWGYPDGMATDAEGGIWIAHWGGARISRFFPDGRLHRAIPMPASKITSIAFGGDDLRRMFVTSASLDSEGEPAAGALFEIDAGVQGIAANTFAG